ncbi:MAG: hypothetical protein IJD63_02575 [Oscillospiraceae bacterium]|nr:hypothetical protein [Oscillospiraceae bacterium]
MKRNLFAIFLALALVVALAFVVAPTAKADAMTVVQATEDKLPEGFDVSKNILDLNGHKVTVETDATISVINTSFITNSGLLLDGTHAGSLTITGGGSVNPVATDGKFQYLAVATTVDEVTTYNFHPFNLGITRLGLNTIGKNNENPAVCIEVTFIANDVVKAKLNEEGNDYGLKNPDVTALNSDETDVGSAKVNEKYRFGNSNGVKAYYDLKNSLTGNIDETYNVQAYMVIDGTEITNLAVEVTPREVLKDINKDVTVIPTSNQMSRIEELFDKDGYARFKNILTRFRPKEKDATLSFADTAQRTEYSTTKQVWEQNGIKLTNNKSSSTTNVGDYADPVRLYKSSEIVVEASGMTKIVFNCTSGYVLSLPESTEYDVTTESTTVTVVFREEAFDSFTATMMAQTRFSSIVVTAPLPGECDHHGGTASCTEKAVCIDCDNAYGELADHDYDEETNLCSCGAKNPTAYTPKEIVEAAYALEKDATLGEYTLTGTITKIEDSYSTQYQNISVDIVIEGCEDKPILCFRMTGDGAASLKVGDVITVTGTIKNYKGTVEFDAACTFVLVSAHEHSHTAVVTAPTCTDNGYTTYTCSCGDTYNGNETEKLGHDTTDGICGRCGEEIGGDAPALTEETYSYTFAAKQYTANGTKELGDVEWTLAGNGGYWGYDSTKGQQFGSKNSTYTSLTLTSASFSNVKSITINTSGASDIKASFTVSVGGTQVGSADLTKTATEYTFTLDEALTGEVVFTYTQTSSKALYIKSIEIVYAE